MAQIGTPTDNGKSLTIVGIAGVDTNNIVIEADDLSRFSKFILTSSAGAMDVDVSLDGTNFIAAIALENRKSTTPATRVVVTVAAGLYSFEGPLVAVRVRQDGATGVANAILVCK